MCQQWTPTIVCGRLLVLVGGGQRRNQRLHVHDEVLVAQRVVTSTLAKLGSGTTTITTKKQGFMNGIISY